MGEPIPEQGYRSKHRLAGLSMSHKQLTVVLPATRELVALETDHHSSKAIEDPWLVFGFLGEVNGGQDERLGRRHKLRHKGGLSRPLAYLTGQGWVLDLDLNWRRGETASLRVGDLPDRSRSSIHGAMHGGHARDAGNDTLDRFEAAVAYAIREAARLQRGPESRLMVVSQTEDSTR
jgi:hypothetical protein